MSRNSFNDIVPPERRSIRNISRTRRVVTPQEQTSEYRDIPPAPPAGRGGANFFSQYGMWIVSAVLLVIFIIVFSLIFSGSKIVVNPKQKEVAVNGVFTALREPEVGDLSYDIMRLEETISQKVKATGKEQVEERASGKIVVFNSFSSKSQRLITNTRFETPEGLVYRIREPIVVPGQTKNSDGTTLPGSIEAMVYADEPGEKYNAPLTDFTIPGFKGSPQYEKFYARSKTTMTGGFSGERLKVEESLLADTRGTLQEKLREKFLEQIEANAPEGFYSFEGVWFYEFPDPTIFDEGGDKARIEQTGVVYVVLFEDKDFAQHIALETVAGYEGGPVYLLSTNDLALETSNTETSRPWEESQFTFSVKGSARIIWLFDENKLKEDLAGRPKASLPTILSGYPAIDKAQVVLRPFWKQSFGDNPEKISVEIKLEK